MCVLPQNLAHCHQRAMAARRKNNRNVGWKNSRAMVKKEKNTSRPYHCTFHCWCNNYAKANNIWQTFKNASSQNIHMDVPHFASAASPLEIKKKTALRPTQTHPKLCFPATNVFDNMQHCNKLTNNESSQQTCMNMYIFIVYVYTASVEGIAFILMLIPLKNVLKVS